MLGVIKSSNGFDILVDDCDIPKLNDFIWYARVRDGVVKYVYNHKCGMLHRYILGLDRSESLVDHIDRSPLNNQKENLRITSKAENAANTEKKSGNYTSRYKGVGRGHDSPFYRVRVKNLEFGLFLNEIDAANAYNFYVKYLYEIPYLNEVPETDWYKRKRYRGSSYYRGVAKSRDKWCAKAWAHGRSIHLGMFETQLDAAIRYNEYALEHNFSLNKINVISYDGDVLVTNNMLRRI